MKRDLKRYFKGLNGKEATEAAPMSEQVAACLFAYGNDDPQTPADDKYKAWQISQRIAANPSEVELSAEDITLVKKAANKMFAAGFYGQVVDALED